MRILLIAQNFYPENFKSNDIAFELVQNGFEVDVLTSIPNYPYGKYYKGYGIFKKRRENINGVNVFRVFQTPRGKKSSLLGLFFNYLTFTFFSTLKVLYHFLFKKRYDTILVFQTSPVMQAIPAIVLGKLRRIPVLTWVQDVWPDSALSALKKENTSLNYILGGITEFVYKKSDKILISSEGFSALINRKNNYSDKIIYFPNWADDILKMPNVDVPKIPDGFIIMMAGNLGIGQDLESVVKSIELLRNESDLKWVFVGDGTRKKWLEDYVKKNGLEEKVILLGRLPFEMMPALYERADVMLLCLRDQFLHLSAVVPSRFQSYLSASKPVFAMINGDSADIIKKINCGKAAPAGDYKAFSALVSESLSEDKGLLQKLGLNGRNYYEKKFTKTICINNLISIINEL